MKKVIYIGSDHAGYEMKSQLLNFITSQGFEVVDKGTMSTASIDYPDFAFLVAEAVASNKGTIGILICGTGFGMCIAANKVKGIRAINIVRADMAPLAVEHNNANILCLSARFVTIEENKQIIQKFLSAQFTEERHQKRIDKISRYEGN